MLTKGLFTWSGGPRSSGVGFFCFVSPRAWKQKKTKETNQHVEMLLTFKTIYRLHYEVSWHVSFRSLFKQMKKIVVNFVSKRLLTFMPTTRQKRYRFKLSSPWSTTLLRETRFVRKSVFTTLPSTRLRIFTCHRLLTAFSTPFYHITQSC